MPSNLCHAESYVYSTLVGIWNPYVREEPQLRTLQLPRKGKCIRKMWFGTVFTLERVLMGSKGGSQLHPLVAEILNTNEMLFGNLLKGIKQPVTLGN